ncbi:Dynamin-binding protein [Chionoecetes opilio]|uniref:Dynamin-binding protein n=1 Tax=Chionoecetes opilio TaxID=41210 RepID=A0A8J5D0T0_CHIOP|nr:Dynamin-binding protein [Chionoecetes opilio]
MLTQFRVKYLQQVGEFRQLSFIPPECQQWASLPRAAKTRVRKSLDGSAARKEHAEAAKTKVLAQYPREGVYVTREVHTPAEVMELTLYPGDHVALLKNKDPLGRTDRWFVDDGDNKGFVRASCLKPLLEPEGGGGGRGGSGGGGIVAAPPPSLPGSVAPPGHPPPPTTPRPSTVPRPAPAPPEQGPPRYEDIFPADPATVSRGPGFSRPPPPRYSSVGAPTPVPQPPLPAKPQPLPATASGECRDGVGDYYSPPLDRQLSGDYNSPVSEENNIYEEIDQRPRGGRRENGAAAEADHSPIYEVIKDGEIVYAQENTAPASAEPQFYYALYNFGGSDGTQLSLVAGQVLLVLHAVSPDWWFVEDRSGKQGYAPASYLTRYN